MPSDLQLEALGYTLGTGKLMVDFAWFHQWIEDLLERPILTHELADEDVWMQIREAFERRVIPEAAQADGETEG